MVSGVEQVAAQAPRSQTSFAPQAMRQAPQFLGSVLGLVHPPTHMISPAPQLPPVLVEDVVLVEVDVEVEVDVVDPPEPPVPVVVVLTESPQKTWNSARLESAAAKASLRRFMSAP